VVKADQPASLPQYRAADYRPRRVAGGANCHLCVLVTSSLVAVRGLVRSLHSNFGFEPRTPCWWIQSEHGRLQRRQSARHAKRMIDAVRAIPGVKSVGLVKPAGWGREQRNVFTDKRQI
jgi:hypothetical protein